MAFKDFPDTPKGRKERREYYESEDGLAMIEEWRRRGLKIEQIAEDYIGVSQYTFQKWRKDSAAIRAAMNTAIEVCNANVEKSLYQRAVGYYYDEDTYELVEGEMRLTKRVTKHIPPDTKAIMHWLYNKLPDRYRCIQEPLEATQYVNTVKNILVAMKEVAETGEKQIVDAEDMPEE